VAAEEARLGGDQGVRPRLGCHCQICPIFYKTGCGIETWGLQELDLVLETSSVFGSIQRASFRILEGNHCAPVIAPQQHNRRAYFL